MTPTTTLEPKLFRIAILALGGQGGGVLVDWVVDLAEHAGWTAQATSVAGVAQRTGATIYYIEIMEPTPGREPVLALMPVPGDVDILVAAELMEAGRAVERGLVTPDRTVLVASSHRTFSAGEKIEPGNGIADSAAVLEVLRSSAKRLVVGDLQSLAVSNGSVISACLFGALAGSGALPFERKDFEEVVERSGVGVKASLKAMRAAYDLGGNSSQGEVVAGPAATMETPPRPLPTRAASHAMQPLLDRIRTSFPTAAWDWLGEGLARVVDWQDLAYGHEYLDRVSMLVGRDSDDRLAVEAARWIAVAMSYDDVIRVADLKTRLERSQRIRSEIAADRDDVFSAEEYFHPRLEEAMGLLPRAWADRLDRWPGVKAWLAPRLDRGRRIQSQSLRGHVQLRLLAGLRRWRRGMRRHVEERAHLERWLSQVKQTMPQNGELAIELLRCRRVVKGYSDTHARGSSRFDRLMAASNHLRGRNDAAIQLAALRDAALKDAEGKALDEKLARLGIA